MSYKKEANIMILGQTGSGKSSFLNYLIGIEKYQAGNGKPVTPPGEFQTEQFEHNDFQINAIDSWGLEVDKLNDWKDEIFKKTEGFRGKKNINEWLHGLIYCINSSTHRVQDAELDFINELSTKAENLLVVLTNADAKSEKETKELRTTILNDLEKIKKSSKTTTSSSYTPLIEVFEVCSVSKKTRTGESKPFGKEDVLNNIFKHLLVTICRKAPSQMKDEVDNIIDDGIDIAKDSIRGRDLSFSIFDIFSISEKINKMENSLDSITSEMDSMREDIEKKIEVYQDNINNICDYCNDLHETLFLGDKLFDLQFDIFDDFDFDSVLEKSDLGKLMSAFDNMDENSAWENIKTILSGIGAALGLEDKIIEVINDLRDDLKSHVREKIDTVFENILLEYKKSISTT